MIYIKKTDLIIILAVLLTITISCTKGRYRAVRVTHVPPVDTRSIGISQQEKQVYSFNSGKFTIDNMFDGARLNNCNQDNDSSYTITISPENYPINFSPWYAFRIISDKPGNVTINIEYQGAKHRYSPKCSIDKTRWISVDSADMELYPDTTGISFSIELTSDTTWVSAQELEDSKDVFSFWEKKISSRTAQISSIGESKLGRPLWMIDINEGENKRKPIVVILSRQHPPEITGYYGMKAFLERIVEMDNLSDSFLNRYRILVFPLVNPDGVDMGHWRSNAGGVDLNRDWGTYNQPEVRAIADRIVYESGSTRSDVVLGLDFHSTSRDIYYTNIVESSELIIGDFKNRWIYELNQIIPGEALNESPSAIYPELTSKNWFYNQLNSEGIIYEVGDNTPRELIKYKADISAEIMMNLLLDKI